MTHRSVRLRRVGLAVGVVPFVFGLVLSGPPDSARAETGVAPRAERSAEAATRGPAGHPSRWRDASPAERRRMRARARERWENATPRERRAFVRGMRGLARALPEFSVLEQRLLLRHMLGMPKTERHALRARLRDIDDLEPEARARFVEALRGMLDESPEEAARIERNIERWRRMSEAEREQYRDQMRRFRSMSPEERRKLLDEWTPPADPEAADEDEP